MIRCPNIQGRYGSYRVTKISVQWAKYNRLLFDMRMIMCIGFPKLSITKTHLYNFDPLIPHFYIVKLGFTGIYIIFLISAQKHRLWVLVRTASARRF